MDVRLAAARHAEELGFPSHKTNGDERLYPPTWCAYSKGLPHTAEGEADERAMRALLDGLVAQDSRSLEAVPLGGYIKLANPQAAFAFELFGPDSHQLTMTPPPSFHSAEQASEMVELYWQALARDVPFANYESDRVIRDAASELTRLSGFRGPRDGGRVTPANIFRGNTRGGQVGPYLSQFLLRDIPWTPIRVPQRIRIAAPGKDYLTDAADWLRIQNGDVFPVNDYETTPRYARTGRDLAEYMHRDFTYQAFLGACLMLFRMSAPVDGGIPYQHSISQSGFVTFGPSDILHLVATVANLALKTSWYQKWAVHRRLRPEEFGGRVHHHFASGRDYPLHVDLLNATVLDRVFGRYHTRLLPQSYPEGSPMHPAYPSGHAVIAGACVTALKACFAESFVIPDPVVPSADGLTLRPYGERELTVGGELDKLAENVSMGRNFAGIHWRTDAIEGMKLGEAVAIEIIRELKMTANETFDGYALTRFDGTRVVIR